MQPLKSSDNFTPDLEYFNPPSILRYFLGRALRKLPFITRILSITAWEYPDCIQTPHNKSFIQSDFFSESYRRAIRAGGFDYRIPWRVHQVLWAIQSTLHLDGDLVELGTGKGFIMSAVLSSIDDWNARKKQCWLYDVFQKPSISGLGEEKYASYYADDYKQVELNFSEWERIKIINGDIFSTLSLHSPQNISFLHVDLNNAEAEIYAVQSLWDRIIPGGIIILDDYANRGHEKQYNALNKLFNELSHSILSTPSGQGIIIKKAKRR